MIRGALVSQFLTLMSAVNSFQHALKYTLYHVSTKKLHIKNCFLLSCMRMCCGQLTQTGRLSATVLGRRRCLCFCSSSSSCRRWSKFQDVTIRKLQNWLVSPKCSRKWSIDQISTISTIDFRPEMLEFKSQNFADLQIQESVAHHQLGFFGCLQSLLPGPKYRQNLWRGNSFLFDLGTWCHLDANTASIHHYPLGPNLFEPANTPANWPLQRRQPLVPRLHEHLVPLSHHWHDGRQSSARGTPEWRNDWEWQGMTPIAMSCRRVPDLVEASMHQFPVLADKTALLGRKATTSEQWKPSITASSRLSTHW